MKLYFVRHGESKANLLHEFSNSGRKHPLTALGVSQAQEVAYHLSGLRVDRVFTSPILRAVQTAEIICKHLVIPLEVNPALREWSVGIYEGRRDPVGWALHRQVQEDWFCHGRPESKMPGGENFQEIQARFVPFIEGLLSSTEPDSHGMILVGHGGLYLAMLPVILRNITHKFALQAGFPYTGMVVAELRQEGLYCVEWCGETLS